MKKPTISNEQKRHKCYNYQMDISETVVHKNGFDLDYYKEVMA